MEGGLILLCKYISDTLPIKVSAGGDLNSVLRKLCDNWNSLEVDTILLRYCVPGHDRCFLRNEEEFRNMISLISAFELKFVDISVSDSKTVSLDCKTVSHDCDTVFENEGSAITTYCSSTNSRALLSSSWSSVITHVGQRFERGVAEFRDALCKFSIERGFKFDYMRNNNGRVEAQCSNRYSDDCRWYICATVSKVSGFCYIRKLVNEHSCPIVLRKEKSERLSCKVISGLIVDILREKPTLCSNDIVLHFLTNYGYTISYEKAWKALERAKGLIFGDASESFKQLHWYIEAARSFNHGSHIDLEVDQVSKRFQRLFVSYHACIHVFNHCRPVLFIDGTFLKGRFKGILLSATAKNGLYPLAYAVVDSENYDNWLWFLEQLRSIVQSEWMGVVCPKMIEKLQGYTDESRSWNIKRSSDTIFEVFSDPSVCVDICKSTCSCFQWQLNGFPSFRKSYEEVIHPIPTSMRLEYENSANFDILPPPTKRQPGRPKKRRIRSRGEQVRMIRCCRCGKLGNHNKKTCKESLV
ncbi:MuDR family transposase [Abeliophyllum distichum]|uniref:MuDR family transposase n=1 Tax=Abeliophyllum distichum TaxID=126358 RepID=A0ABD1UJJ0_9LAMI